MAKIIITVEDIVNEKGESISIKWRDEGDTKNSPAVALAMEMIEGTMAALQIMGLIPEIKRNNTLEH